MTLRSPIYLCLAVVFGLAACDLSEPLTPIAEVRLPIFRECADPVAWAQTDETTRAAVWASYEAEFWVLRSAKDYPLLLRLAQEAHHLFPQERKAWLNLSTALMIQSQFGQSITAARGAISENREDRYASDPPEDLIAHAWCNIASDQIEMGLLPDALEAADNAIAAAPNLGRAHLLRGEVLHRLERDEEAVASYQRGFDLDPQFPDVSSSDHVIYGLALNAIGRLEAGEQALRDGIEAIPQGFGLHYHLALNLQQQGRLEDAFYEHNHELFLRPDTPYGRRVVADLGAMIDVARQRPDTPESQRLLRLAEAQELRRRGQLGDAAALYEELLADRPEGDDTIFLPLTLGQIERERGNLEAAIAWHREVLSRDPNYVPSLVEISEMQEELGDQDTALITLREAQRTDPLNWRLLSHFEAFPGAAQALHDLTEAEAASAETP